MHFTAVSSAALALAAGVFAGPVQRDTAAPSTLSIQEQLELAGTAVDRLNLLAPEEFVFDFNITHPGIVTGAGGKTVKADRDTFPALIGTSGSMTLGFIGPCGFNTPHTHPRAAEMNIVVQGRLIGSVTPENGAAHRSHELNKFQMTVFPQGAMHTEFNPDCEPAVFVAAFPSEDPGVQQVAQTFFGLEDDLIKAALGGDLSINGAELDSFRTLIPANVANGVEECLQKCNIPLTGKRATAAYIMRGISN
ncbi:spherulin-1A [Xylogone sp. PMI_703]|nr:spherulin-1A [Xylogone sp. PMI_703]